MRGAALLLVVCLVLSGCSTPLGDGSDEIETVTPVAVPDGTDGPPGLDLQRNTVDPLSLVAAHERAIENGTIAVRFEARRSRLSNRSFGIESRSQPMDSDERVVNDTFVRTADPTVFYQYSNDSAGYTYGTWSNGTHTVEYADVPRGIVRTIVPSPSRPEQSFDTSRASTLRVWFNNSQVQTVDRVETTAGVRYRVTATSDDRDLLGSSADRTHNSVRNGTLTATIRPDGLVTDLQLSFTLLTRAGNFPTSYRYSVTPTVETLPQPAWVDRAFARGNTSFDT